MISPLNAKLDRKWIEASQRIATLEQQNAELVAENGLMKLDIAAKMGGDYLRRLLATALAKVKP